jgi:ribosomal protein L21E
METILYKVKQNLRSAWDKKKSYANLKRTQREFNVGDHVYIKVKPRNNSFKLGKSSKLSPRYCGPFEVFVGHIVIDVLSLMSTVEDHCDLMMNLYYELSLMKNMMKKNVIKRSE